MTQTEGLTKLRLAINENLRVQRGGPTQFLTSTLATF